MAAAAAIDDEEREMAALLDAETAFKEDDLQKLVKPGGAEETIKVCAFDSLFNIIIGSDKGKIMLIHYKTFQTL